MNTKSAGPAPAGWYPDPSRAAASRFWNGREWTSSTLEWAREPATGQWLVVDERGLAGLRDDQHRRRRASGPALLLMAAVALLGGAVLFLGLGDVFVPECSASDSEVTAYVTALWLPWVVICAAAIVAVVIWRRNAPRDALLAVPALLGVLSAIASFPPVQWIAWGFDCGL